MSCEEHKSGILSDKSFEENMHELITRYHGISIHCPCENALYKFYYVSEENCNKIKNFKENYLEASLNSIVLNKMINDSKKDT